MVDSNAKGDRIERELVNKLDESGYAVMRAPASGSATERELPDLLAGDGTRFYAVEVKASGGDPIYLDGDEIVDLTHFADNFGATAKIGARFDRCDWAFFAPDELHRTPSGNYRVKQATAEESGQTYDELA